MRRTLSSHSLPRRDMTTRGTWKIICPGCGDDPARDWLEVSPELQAVRGVHDTAQEAEDALTGHLRIPRRR